MAGHAIVSIASGDPDTTGNKRWIRFLEVQYELLELIAKGASLEFCLERLCHVIERLFEGALCSISLLDADGIHLRHAAGPNLPGAYKRAIRSIKIGPVSGPCGIAAYRRAPVVVPDILKDPIWAEFQELALPLGLRSCASQPILDRDGQSIGTIALYRHKPYAPDLDDCHIIDAVCQLARIVIEHDRRAEALQFADERFASLAANVPGVVYQRLVTPDGDIRYTYISNGAQDLFGVSPEEILADPRSLFDCHGAEYRRTFRQRLLAASRELTMWDVEAPIITRNGEHKWTHAIARPQRQPDGSVLWTGIILDATRLKNASLELAAANRAKSEFLANMSHELRTPLNAIIGFSELMLSKAFGELGSPRYEGYVADIAESGKQLLQIINDILDLAKVEAGKMELIEESIDPLECIKKCIRLLEDKAHSQNITLSTYIEDRVPRLRADERKMKQILINILSNSLKFTLDGGAVSVTAKLEKDGQLAISISDTGVGIASEDLPKVLEPFTQVDSGLNRKFDGTGLGLPLTKAMIELHGGTIEVKSQVGEGTTVTCRFPQERLVR